jgi:hypothetical protein
MHHTSSHPHTPPCYATIPMEHLARAQCYGCGLELWAAHLIWIAHPTLGDYLALCESCYGASHGDVTLMLAAQSGTLEGAREGQRS